MRQHYRSLIEAARSTLDELETMLDEQTYMTQNSKTVISDSLNLFVDRMQSRLDWITKSNALTESRKKASAK